MRISAKVLFRKGLNGGENFVFYYWPSLPIFTVQIRGREGAGSEPGG